MKPSALITAATLGLFAFSSIASAAPKKLLVVTITSGFRHGPAIEAAEKVLPEIAAKSGGDLAFEFLSEPGPKPNAGPKPVRTKLMSDAQWVDEEARYKAAEAKARSEQGKDLMNKVFVTGAAGFIGMHAATDTLKNMQSYYDMINGSFAGHPWGGGGTYTFANHEPSHPVVAMFQPEFQWKDEIYQYTHFNPESVRVLISIDMAKSLPQAPYHVPVSWVRNVGDGRLFYTNLGHNASTWSDATYQQHITAGIRWALKLIDGPAEVNPAVSAQQALKSIAAAAGTMLKLDAAALEAKAQAKAKADPAWGAKLATEGDGYRLLPTPKKDGKPEEIEQANTAKSDLLKMLVSQIEN